MKYNKTIKSHLSLSFLIALSLGLTTPQLSLANSVVPYKPIAILDSIGNEIVNGNRFVIHKLESGQTYYQLSRIYSLPVKEIIAANNNKGLRVGDTVKIPRGKSTVVTPPETKVTIQTPTVATTNNNAEITEYKVGKSETLYSIARRFQLTVDEIKRYNNLASNNLREGMILKIPKHNAFTEEVPETPAPIITALPEIIEENQPIDDAVFKANRYGIREKKERGVGVWLDSLKGDGQTSLALHKSAPIGTILKITNPMNQSVTFAKVVGKFGDNEDTQGAIVVLSKSAAASVGVLDKKFQVELAYGVPLD